MLLVIDVGNTHTVLGVYQGDQLRSDWRIHTERNTTEDEFNVLINSLFIADNIQSGDIEQTIISCVVPPMVTILDAFCRKYIGHPPTWVDAKNCAGMPILLKNPGEVGADRIVNAVAAFHRYRRSLIVVDFGTATTFDAISEKGEYLGGAISPGIGIASEALFLKASKLPRVEIFSPPEKVIGKDTIGSIQSGIIFGYAGLVDGIVRRMQLEMGTNPKVIATGGLAQLLFEVSETIEAVEPALTLEGLKVISNNMA
ncbi:MAG: type III pantothenate kinase [Deltaproteobacteria bacterium]|jgi:type III pantothenate kinase|nr:type III pantothenate kinase [Deltaproteobacteria bacterium]MBW2488844.1 type III pantothenate kinase [Deltaproteobacteria bacterium]MBW2517485.1 type III pantothenate kinase [Deltaproteobacteria bacterium]